MGDHEVRLVGTLPNGLSHFMILKISVLPINCVAVAGTMPAIPALKYYLSRDPLIIMLDPITISNSLCQVTYSIDIVSASQAIYSFNSSSRELTIYTTNFGDINSYILNYTALIQNQTNFKYSTSTVEIINNCVLDVVNTAFIT